MGLKITVIKLLLLFTFVGGNAQSPALIRKMITEDSARLTEIFKDLHRNPELGFMEVRTSSIIARELRSLGFEVITGIAETGVVGILKNGSGPVVMYRADMDCNAVKEITGLEYASTKSMKRADGTEVPVMHACGHDAHMTWMLGVAKVMSNMKGQWKGTLVMLAQPAEEILQGAQAMVKDKMYEEKGVPVPDFLFGMHTWPVAVGVVINGTGDRFAGSDQLDVTFNGIGGHGSAPENTKDPIVMAASAIMQYQTIISRSIAAQDAAVLTVGAFHAGTDNNVIPPSAIVKLNLRWFNEKSRNVLLEGIKNINEGIAIANGLSKDQYPVITMKSTVYPLVNDAALSTRMNKALSPVLGSENVLENIPPIMGSEDFHHLVMGNNKTTYNYILVGTAHASAMAKAKQEGKKAPFFIHSGNYIVDLSSIPIGTLIGTFALFELFKK
jgi:amidohydrolase